MGARGATAGLVGELSLNHAAEVPTRTDTTLCLHLASPVYTEKRFVDEPHEGRVKARSAALVHVRSRDAVGQVEQLRVGDKCLEPLQRRDSNAGRRRVEDTLLGNVPCCGDLLRQFVLLLVLTLLHFHMATKMS